MSDSLEIRPMLGRDQVYAYLREAILTGELEPEAKIKETYYTKRFGVSRTPIREALRLLEKEGLVVYIPQRGAFVRGRLTEKEIRQVFLIRKALLISSVDSMIDNATEDDIACMEECNRVCKQAIMAQDYPKYAKYSYRFEQSLIESSKLDLLISMLLQMEQVNPLFSFIGEKAQAANLLIQKYRCETELREQIDILESIKSRDREQLREMLERHVLNTKQAYLRVAAIK